MTSCRARLVAALCAVTLWSTNAYAAEIALGQMSLGWLLLVQYGTAATALLAVGLVSRVRRGAASSTADGRSRADAETGRRSGRALIVGVVGLTGTIFLQYLAFATAPIVAANVLTYGWPLLAAVWIAATSRTGHALRSAGLALVGFGGVALIFSSPGQAAGDTSVSGLATWGYLAALGSAACMAMYTVGVSRITTTATGLLVPATLTGVLAAALLTILSGGPPPTVPGLLVAAYIGLGPMAAGYALWTRAMSGGGAERLSPLGYATSLLSTVLLFATGAPASAGTLVGVALVLACSIGVLAHDWNSNRRAEPSGRPRPDRQRAVGQ